MIEKAPQRQVTPQGRIIDHCADCKKYGRIVSNTSGRDLCGTCDVKSKATDAGMKAMKE